MSDMSAGKGAETNTSILELQPNWSTMSADARTSWFISEMLTALTREKTYAGAMDSMLDMMSMVIHTDRMSIFECGGEKTTVTFERCAEGMQSLLGVVLDLPRWAINKWFSVIGDAPVGYVPNVAVLEQFSRPLYEWCRENDIHSFMAAPFFNDGEIVGFLGAYNCRVEDTVDLDRLFTVVSTFIGARIENRKLINDLAWRSDHDSLTNLLNRRGSIEAIKKFHYENPDEPCAFILIDLDDFKRINDVYGHAAGDVALQAVAQAMTRSFPAGAILSRNGGDEFVATLTGEDAKNVDELVERFAHTVLEYEFDGERRRMTTSIGYASYPDQAVKAKHLYEKADAALYTVKLAGKAGYAKYTPEAEMHYRSRLGFTARDIVENAPYCMVVHAADPECSILFASDQFAQLTGCENTYELMQLSGGSLLNLIADADRGPVLTSLKQLAEHGGQTQIKVEYQAKTKAGGVRSAVATSRFVSIQDVGDVFYSIIRPVKK